MNPPLPPPSRRRRHALTQWVYLDFTTYTTPTSVIYVNGVPQLHDGTGMYSMADEQAVLTGLEGIYAPFNTGPIPLIEFTLDASVIPAGTPYETVYFNDTPISNGQPSPGGFSDEIDFGNLNHDTSMQVDVNGFLETARRPPSGPRSARSDSDTDFVNLTTTITAHELGHTLGLRHEDSLGPVGFGITNPPGLDSYYPDYTGLVGAFTTDDHIIDSPASVGSTLEDAADGEAEFGEREAVKLAFILDGTVVDGTNTNNVNPATNTAATGNIVYEGNAADPGAVPFTVAAAADTTTNIGQVTEDALVANPTTAAEDAAGVTVSAQPVSLYALNVPNPITTGFDADMKFDVDAVDVLGHLGGTTPISYTDPVTGQTVNTTVTSPDFYTFQGNAGDLMNFEVMSAGLTRITDPIDSVIYVYGPGQNGQPGQLLAWNDDQFEPSDSSIVDLTLPTTGTYTVEVDSFNSTDPSLLDPTSPRYNPAERYHAQQGDYELFMYRSVAYNPTGGNDVLLGSNNTSQTVASTAGASPTYGQPITLTATLDLTISSGSASALNSSPLAPTGTVTFWNGATSLGTAPIVDGVASLTPISALPAGGYTITADYSGDDNFAPSSNSSSLAFNIGKAGQTINFAAPTSPIPFIANETVTLSASASSGDSVVFTIDGGSTGKGSISGDVLTITGAGSFVIDANQAGDADYNAAPQVQRTILAPILVLKPVSASVQAGAADTFTLIAEDGSGNTVTGFTGAITLSGSDASAAFTDKATGLALTNDSYTFTAADDGFHTFTVTDTLAGSFLLTATDAGANLTTSTGLTITAALSVASTFNTTLLQNVTSGSIKLATFNESGGSANAADYTATVAWGDNTSGSSAGSNPALTVVVAGSRDHRLWHAHLRRRGPGVPHRHFGLWRRLRLHDREGNRDRRGHERDEQCGL